MYYTVEVTLAELDRLGLERNRLAGERSYAAMCDAWDRIDEEIRARNSEAERQEQA